MISGIYLVIEITCHSFNLMMMHVLIDWTKVYFLKPDFIIFCISCSVNLSEGKFLEASHRTLIVFCYVTHFMLE